MTKLVCRVELNKKSGIILTVENRDDNITQTMVMDGAAITTSVKGADETSIITQKQDSIAMSCKTFTLNADSITCASKKDTLHKSGQKFDIQSSQDMTLKTDSKLIEKAVSDVKISGNNLLASADNNATLSGDVKVEVKTATLNLSGSARTEMKGGKVDINATGILNVKAKGVLTAEGSMTNVKGKMVKIG